MTVWISVFTAVTLWLRNARAPVVAPPRRFRAALAILALAAVVDYTHGFEFHGGRSWIHEHDVAHYYLGAKYFRELGYGTLYIALIRAEAEDLGHIVSGQARDLGGNFLVPAETLLERSEDVRRRFSLERWGDFRKDAALFRRDMGYHYPDLVKDHGYNPTPVWTLVGSPLANAVPAGSARGLFALTLIDPLLLIGSIAAVGVVFGIETALLVLIYRCVCFGAGFDWLGGSFLRELTFSAMLFMACALGRNRPATAGAWLGFAAMLRVFPAILPAGVISAAAVDLLRKRSANTQALRFVLGMGLTCTVMFLASLAYVGGLQPWEGFVANISRHSQSGSANVIGLSYWITTVRSIDLAAPGGLDELLHWHAEANRLQLLIIAPLVLAYVLFRSRGREILEILALGVLVVFAALNLSAYYYTMLVLLVIAYRERYAALAWLFTVELGVYALALIERDQVMLYMYKSLLLLGAFVLIQMEDWRMASARSSRSL